MQKTTRQRSHRGPVGLPSRTDVTFKELDILCVACERARGPGQLQSERLRIARLSAARGVSPSRRHAASPKSLRMRKPLPFCVVSPRVSPESGPAADLSRPSTGMADKSEGQYLLHIFILILPRLVCRSYSCCSEQLGIQRTASKYHLLERGIYVVKFQHSGECDPLDPK